MDRSAGSLIITFGSSYMAIRAERALKALGISVELIPVPREISSACGFCLLVPASALGGSGLDTIKTRTAQGREALWLVTIQAKEDNNRKEKTYERISQGD